MEVAREEIVRRPRVPLLIGFNPYCDGSSSGSTWPSPLKNISKSVSILIVMEVAREVIFQYHIMFALRSFNPYCDGSSSGSFFNLP